MHLVLLSLLGTKCRELFPPQPYGLMEPCNNTVNSTCHFGCVAGYVIEGPSVRTCQASSQWNNKAPNCTGKIKGVCVCVCVCVWAYI